MTAVAASMRHNIDPSVIPTSDSSWMSDGSGYIFLDTWKTSPRPLRVLVYVAARPVAPMRAVQSSLDYGGTGEIDLTGTGINTDGPYAPPPDITSMVVPFEAQFHQDIAPTGVPYLDAATFKDIGITSDKVAAGDLTGTEIYVGLATAGNWSTPSFWDTEFDVYFDTNNDGIDDYALFNTFFPESPDTFVTELVNLHTFGAVYENYLDGVPGNYLDIAPYNNSALVMPVFASDLGLTPAHSRFTYWVGAGTQEIYPYYADMSPLLHYDAGHPGLDFTGHSIGIPAWADLAGGGLPVTYPSLAAYQNANSQGVLLLHLHNDVGNRDEVLTVHVPVAQLSSPSRSVPESAGTVG